MRGSLLVKIQLKCISADKAAYSGMLCPWRFLNMYFIKYNYYKEDILLNLFLCSDGVAYSPYIQYVLAWLDSVLQFGQPSASGICISTTTGLPT